MVASIIKIQFTYATDGNLQSVENFYKSKRSRVCVFKLFKGVLIHRPCVNNI